MNGVVQTSTEKPKSSQSREKEGNGPPHKSRASDNGRSNRPTNQEQKDGTARKFPNHPRDERTESRRVNIEKTNNRYTTDGRPSFNNPREKETRTFHSESLNRDRSRQGNQADDDRQNNRTEQSERTERPTARGQPLRTQVSSTHTCVKLQGNRQGNLNLAEKCSVQTDPPQCTYFFWMIKGDKSLHPTSIKRRN